MPEGICVILLGRESHINALRVLAEEIHGADLILVVEPSGWRLLIRNQSWTLHEWLICEVGRFGKEVLSRFLVVDLGVLGV